MLLRRVHNVKLGDYLFLESSIDIFRVRLRIVTETRGSETTDTENFYMLL